MIRAPECRAVCQYAQDVQMLPEHRCADECVYLLKTCPRCGGEGHRYSGNSNDPNPSYAGICETCDGTGRISDLSDAFAAERK